MSTSLVIMKVKFFFLWFRFVESHSEIDRQEVLVVMVYTIDPLSTMISTTELSLFTWITI